MLYWYGHFINLGVIIKIKKYELQWNLRITDMFGTHFFPGHFVLCPLLEV